MAFLLLPSAATCRLANPVPNASTGSWFGAAQQNNDAIKFSGGLYSGVGMTPQKELARIDRQIAQTWGGMVKEVATIGRRAAGGQDTRSADYRSALTAPPPPCCSNFP
jgi:hypothetical protein